MSWGQVRPDPLAPSPSGMERGKAGWGCECVAVERCVGGRSRSVGAGAPIVLDIEKGNDHVGTSNHQCIR